MPAITAAFVNPDDTRYLSYIGKNVTTPFGDTVKIIADEKAKIDKGTGAVMCCVYGDETDVYRIKKYQLREDHVMINRYGKIENCHVTELNGLKVDDARTEIAKLLHEKGAVVKATPIRQSVSFTER